MDATLLAFGPTLLIVALAMLVLPGLDPDAPVPRWIGAVLCGVLMLRYLAWRATETLPAMDGSMTAILAAGFLGIELLSGLSGLVLFHVLSRSVNRSAEVDRHPVEGHAGGPPPIDMLIATYNEQKEILLRTLVGALAQDYPRFRVWVLDDGRRPWLKDMTEALGGHYLTRPDNAHAKAGNMNAGIAHILSLPDPPTVFAILDADFVATPLFLRRAAALLHDPGVGCVQTPQHFFNPDPIQLNLGGQGLVADEQRFFFDSILAAKDAHGTAFSCGTSSLIRASALRVIGGFPTESVTEDMLLSIKLTSVGLRTVYLNEKLTAGLAPEGMAEYLTQRGRWCLGTMQILRTPWGPFGRAAVPWRVRLHTLDSILFWSAGSLARIALLFVPILYWWCDLVLIETDLHSILLHLGPFWVASMIYLGWVSRGTQVPVLSDAIGLLSVRETLKASAIGLFGSRHQKFKVTAKGASRDRVVVQWGLLGPFLAIGLVTLAGIALRLLDGPLPGASAEVEAMTLFWSAYTCAVLLIACLISVEQPRYRREERFPAEEPVLLRRPGVARPQPGQLCDISLGGCRLTLPARPKSLAIGDAVLVSIAGVGEVACAVRRIGMTGPQASLHLAFAASPAQQAALVRKLFSGDYVPSITSPPGLRLIRLLLRRALG